MNVNLWILHKQIQDKVALTEIVILVTRSWNDKPKKRQKSVLSSTNRILIRNAGSY